MTSYTRRNIKIMLIGGLHVNFLEYFVNPLTTNVTPHIETSLLIYICNVIFSMTKKDNFMQKLLLWPQIAFKNNIFTDDRCSCSTCHFQNRLSKLLSVAPESFVNKVTGRSSHWMYSIKIALLLQYFEETFVRVCF